MTYDEALTIQPGDTLQVHRLTVIVEDIERLGSDIFFCTIYGAFNHWVCEKATETTQEQQI